MTSRPRRRVSSRLLHGVTGSGKTEVYLRRRRACSPPGRTALVLVPEIALTPQIVARFQARFGDTVAVLHSAIKVMSSSPKGKSAANAMTAAEIVSELGREVTQNAILRALNELWSQLRVLPLLQQDGSATMWELTTRRFTKQLKSGANAGQPTALSALISLYLAQVYAALEDEIETFLSPLAARSRVRDVLHGLTAGRQLEDIVLEGKRLLYIPGELPEFPQVAAEQPAEEGAQEAATSSEEAKPEERIRRFDGPRKPREGRPARSFRDDRPRAPRADRSDRPVRSDRSDRPARPSRPFGDRPRPSRDDRPARPSATASVRAGLSPTSATAHARSVQKARASATASGVPSSVIEQNPRVHPSRVHGTRTASRAKVSSRAKAGPRSSSTS